MTECKTGDIIKHTEHITTILNLDKMGFLIYNN